MGGEEGKESKVHLIHSWFPRPVTGAGHTRRIVYIHPKSLPLCLEVCVCGCRGREGGEVFLIVLFDVGPWEVLGLRSQM